ncbi:hypothetical protein [Chitinophaga sp. W2I13]|uniref:hypothetical protein n=1 Tax=Chitinophaga sp. W2I13 TaxID=3373923 RepID=UPI003D1DC462
MDYSKPTLLVISGPNGAGKSTHIESMLPSLFEGVLPFDRDLTRTNIENNWRKMECHQTRSKTAPHK